MPTEQGQISGWRDQLIPNIVDHLASRTPDALYALYPKSALSYEEGYVAVSYKDFANAINGLAWWLQKNMGFCTTFDVIAYIGPNDVRYTTLLLAAIKVGYVAFFTSPRNSIEAHKALFDRLKCRTMLTSSPVPPAAGAVLNTFPIAHLQIPSVEELLGQQHPHFPYEKTYERSHADPLVVIHTSGSTGIPKPLVWTHETMQRHSSLVSMDAPAGLRSLARQSLGKRIINTFPPFHAACLAFHMSYGIHLGSVPIALLSGAIPTAESLVSALEKMPADVAFLVPSIVADLAQDAKSLDYVSRHIQLIIYLGGDLPQAIGDKIASRIPIHCQYGASEIGLSNQLVSPEMTRKDWRWIIYHPNLGFDFEEVTAGMFEMVIKRDPRFEHNQMSFTIGPSLHELQEFRSRDLFAKHPSIANCWGWRARADDILVFLNGEKTNPVSMEQHIIASNVNVTAALVVGSQRLEAALLIEPSASLGRLNPEQATAFVDEVWPSVQEANRTSPAHAQIDKSLIILTSPEKPMMRAGKGTVQRQGTVAQYSEEIDTLYRKVDRETSDAKQGSIKSTDAEQVSMFIKQVMKNINPALGQEETDNFFASGMDSLMAIRLTRALRHGLDREVSASMVHKNPSIQQLVRCISGGEVLSSESHVDALEMKKALIKYENMLERNIGHISGIGASSTDTCVILTGSTGSLGTHILDALLADPKVTRVFALNRRRDARDVYRAKSMSTLQYADSRLTFLQAFLDQPKFGLDDTTFEMLRLNTTLILHNAWPVNFILPLKAFEPQIDGVLNLFKMVASQATPSMVLYISSMSSVFQVASLESSRIIPEETITDFGVPESMGYAQSKLLTEVLCDAAARKLAIPTSFARVGQIAGPVHDAATGIWNPTEWLPSLVITSISFGMIPESLGAQLDKVDWMPVDILAGALLELGMSGNMTPEQGAQAFNVFGPHAITWQQALPNFVKSVERHTDKTLATVPLSSWLDRLRQVASTTSASTTRLSRLYPAIKLLDFYEERINKVGASVEWRMERALGTSTKLRDMPAVGAEWIDTWVQGWVKYMRGNE